VSTTSNTLWPFFLAVILTLGILLTAVVAAMVLSRRRLARADRNYARRLLIVRDQERSLLAGEVHSEMGQRIAALRTELVRSGGRDAPEWLHKATAELEVLGDSLRDLAHRIHPKVVEGHGLGVALHTLQREYQNSFQFDVDLQLRGEPMPKGDLGHMLYRIVQEALNNIRRHAGVQEAEVRVDVGGQEIRIEIEDQGAGFDQDTDRGRGLQGLGLISMRERADLIGGSLDVWSRPGSGTRVQVKVPVPGSTNGQG
jgi:signal transduction histidine kinase